MSTRGLCHYRFTVLWHGNISYHFPYILIVDYLVPPSLCFNFRSSQPRGPALPPHLRPLRPWSNWSRDGVTEGVLERGWPQRARAGGWFVVMAAAPTDVRLKVWVMRCKAEADSRCCAVGRNFFTMCHPPTSITDFECKYTLESSTWVQWNTCSWEDGWLTLGCRRHTTSCDDFGFRFRTGVVNFGRGSCNKED